MVLSYQFSEYHVDFFHYIDHNYFALFEKIRHSIFETGLATPWLSGIEGYKQGPANKPRGESAVHS